MDRIKKEQRKAAKYYQGFVSILPNIFYCLQNKADIKRKEQKTFNDHQKSKKADCNNGLCDLDDIAQYQIIFKNQ
ncbi:46221_t:CDS:2 [Gigaspora margarita]|uniref:46221_t:CDS:1 n=1 Tax=Gigaspora margarita TaxID=4874 RepID=A0ABN7UYL6_GIGMA|nr:46221_t:CDS:2 [Gigaspora margarita]